MIRAVFDTVVFARALINPRGLWGRLVFEHNEHYQLLVSPALIRELLDVVNRPELTSKFRRVEGLDFSRVLQILEAADKVEPISVPVLSLDPKDDVFLATAHLGAADYLISEDHHLLDLRQYQDIQIIDARTFMQVLMK